MKPLKMVRGEPIYALQQVSGSLLTDSPSWYLHGRLGRKQNLVLRGRLFFPRLRDQHEQRHREYSDATIVWQHLIDHV